MIDDGRSSTESGISEILTLWTVIVGGSAICVEPGKMDLPGPGTVGPGNWQLWLGLMKYSGGLFANEMGETWRCCRFRANSIED